MFGELGKVPRLRVELFELRFAASSARPLFPFFLIKIDLWNLWI